MSLWHHRCPVVRNLKRATIEGLRHRRRHRRPWQVRSKWLALLLLGAATVVTWQFARQQSSSGPSHSPSGEPKGGLPPSQRADYASQARSSDSRPLARRVDGVVYPYSVIRGGVANPEELKHVMEYDPVVSRHFRGFNYQRAHLVKLPEEQAMYVSYRIGDRVYWTRRKIKLHSGETLITDGTIVARTRCGNRVARAPLDTGSPLEPSPDDLEQPVMLRDSVPGPPAAAAVTPAPATTPPAVVPAAKKSGWWFIPPPVFVPPGSSGGPLAVTPEPGSILLISSGLAAVYLRSRKTRKKK